MKKVIYTTPEEMERQKKREKKAAKIIFPIAFILAIIIIIATSGEKEPKPITADDIKQGSKVMTRTIIQEQLKAPATAKFGREYVSMKDSVTYVIQNTVDAQNSFGAMIRSEYQVTLLYLGGNPQLPSSWVLIDSKLE